MPVVCDVDVAGCVRLAILSKIDERWSIRLVWLAAAAATAGGSDPPSHDKRNSR